MKRIMVIQGRSLSSEDVALIARLIAQNPTWHRTRLSRELCELWNWRNHKGRLKDMACRSLLRKLDQAGHIKLPTPRGECKNQFRNRSIRPPRHQTAPVESCLRDRLPINVVRVDDPQHRRLFDGLLACYHYLGYSGTVGENMKYIAFDREAQTLACLLFGSAAWSVAPRDAFIGWDEQRRKRGLYLITNNMRFLIPPWVRVPHLASHILSRVAERVSTDWVEKYGHPIYLLETFVEGDRFRGTCYQAANWIHVGQTKGRTRNDRDMSVHVPIKDIYLYPLTKQFRKDLCSDA